VQQTLKWNFTYTTMYNVVY